MEQTIEELRALVLRNTHGQRTETGIPRVAMMRGETRTGLMPVFYEPKLCLVLQGAKSIIIGEELLRYDVASYFISSVEVPAAGQVCEASPEFPCLSITLALDTTVISEVLLTMPAVPEPQTPLAGFGISATTPELLDAWLRLMRLIERPADIPVMAPLLEREIIYRLLQGPRAGLIRQIATAGSRLSQIRKAIIWIRDHLCEPFQVEMLAELAGMSPSTFHRHFKAVTAMSPIQYQKRLRLHEARRRLLSEPTDTAHVAFSVGYESATQFSREYARLFGAPPARDAGRLRQTGNVPAESAAELA